MEQKIGEKRADNSAELPEFCRLNGKEENHNRIFIESIGVQITTEKRCA